MKKTGILTHYQVHNHGAILQMHGLYHTLKNFGFKPHVLTYKKNFSFIPENMSDKYSISLKSLPYYAGYLLKKGIGKTIFNYKKYSMLNKFKANNYTFIPLQESKMDYVAIGSDEVFSLEVGVNIMMYGHTVPCENVFSYAASFGQTDIDFVKERHCLPLIKGGLESLKAICVRDEGSFKTVKDICGIEPEINFDPVLLYGFEKEIKNTRYTPPAGKYLVVYAYDNNMNKPEEIAAVKAYARENNLKIVSAGYYHHWADINLNLNPLELLITIKHAVAVVTDTFHGSVISTLVNTPFAAFVRPININKMTYLLGSLGLSARKMTDFKELPNILPSKINWDEVNATISALRSKGLDYLKGVLNAKK